MTDEQIDRIMINLAIRQGFIDGHRHAADVIKKHCKNDDSKTKEVLINIAAELIEYAAEEESKLDAVLDSIEKKINKELEKCDDQG